MRVVLKVRLKFLFFLFGLKHLFSTPAGNLRFSRSLFVPIFYLYAELFEEFVLFAAHVG